MELQQRKSLRLKNYDYRQPGFYFVTICVKDRKNHFGEVINEKVELSDLGETVNESWLEIPKHFPSVRLDEYVVMPNHVHGIIEIVNGDDTPVEDEEIRPLRGKNKDGGKWFGAQSGSLSSIIRSFKICVTNWCRENDYGGSIWQRSFYDNIVRNNESLDRIREYIIRNPRNWEYDLERKEIYDQMLPEVRKLKSKLHYDDLVG